MLDMGRGLLFRGLGSRAAAPQEPMACGGGCP